MINHRSTDPFSSLGYQPVRMALILLSIVLLFQGEARAEETDRAIDLCRFRPRSISDPFSSLGYQPVRMALILLSIVLLFQGEARAEETDRAIDLCRFRPRSM